MSSSSVGINLGSATGIASDLIGTVNYGISKIDISPIGASGTLFNGTVGISSIPQISIGTIPNIPGGSIVMTNGTIGTVPGIGTISNLGSLTNIGTLPNLPNGTLGSVLGLGTLPGVGTVTNLGSITNIGTLGTQTGLGSVGGLGTLPGVGVITTVTNLSNGTIQNSGTVTGVGSISNIGSIAAIISGTIQNSGTVTGIGTITNIGSLTNIGTIPNIPGGTLGILTNGTLSNSGTTTGVGTITNLGSVTNIGQLYNAGTIQAGTIGTIGNIGTLPNLPGGSIVVTSGTINSGTITAGTINTGTFVYTGGTLNLIGTLQAGTVVNNGGSVQISPKPAVNILTYGTVSSGTIGTLIAAPGAGTAINILSFAIDGDAGILGTTDVCLSFGTATGGSAVLFRGGVINPFGQTFTQAVNGNITNTAFTWLQLANTGTVSISMTYFIQ